MRRRKLEWAQESGEQELINLTPLLDVLFVVLILFMLAAPLLQIDKVELAQSGPESKNLSSSTSPLLNILVTKENHILIGHKEVPHHLLVPLLKALKTRYPTDVPTVFHDEKATFGTYQTLKNALEEAGFHEMEIAVKAH